ncbi:MAG: hypothetical protein EOP04_24875 [Proteobacteria bacterium]|nr:MAG: hypothetical protein EOP04_24875 [Pseudomonadota bacterium]
MKNVLFVIPLAVFSVSADARTLYQAYFAKLPDASPKNVFGVGIESLTEHQDLLYGLIDHSAYHLRAFPKVIAYSKAERSQHRRNGQLRTPQGSEIGKDWFSYFDAGYTIETCGWKATFCLGISPLSVNLYTTFDRIRTYFSPSISLGIYLPAMQSVEINVAFDTKTYLDKNISDMIRSEITTWTLGLSAAN